MKKLVIIFCLFTFFITLSLNNYAQNNLPPAYEIKNDTIPEFFLDSTYWQILADQYNNLVFEKVREAPLSNNFQDIQSAKENFKTPCYTYWYRYRIKNPHSYTVRICVGSVAPRADFYFIDSSGTVRHYRSGRNYKLKEKDGFKRINLVPVEIPPHEEVTVYLRRYQFVKSTPANQKIKISNAYYAIKNELTTYDNQYYRGEFVVQPFFAGLFILAAFFNIFFFFVVREKVYLYLSLFLLAFSVSTSAIIPEVLFPTSNLVSSMIDGFIFIGLFFLLQFVRYYFKTFTLIPGWDKALRILGILLCAYYLFYKIWGDQLSSSASNFIPAGLGGLLFISLILTVFRARKKQTHRATNFFIIAVVPFLVLFSVLLILALTFALAGQVTILNKYNIWFELALFALLAWAAIVFSWALFDRYNIQRKEIEQQAIDKERERNELINKQKIELELQVVERTSELKKSLEELKLSQAQLIQSEKMASLGELTAGIAHEIQNPLNFVNNFSEVNEELLRELKTEAEKGNLEEVKAIANDIAFNSEKINHHGRRADSIVKGMLQHSRTSNGQKEQADINALVDEYLRLSYHGLRAKDKSFNADFKTDFDESIGNINIIPQDIGRVVLNLINNAFYAVDEKKRSGVEGFEPTVSVSTKKEKNKIEIKVKDNGNGIPQKVLDKIFQPFFTTKPTGQGTGLGLSLSYDIVKAHGGELKVETEEGEGSAFTIILSI
jgi:two-component system NtrC family sensor kinase